MDIAHYEDITHSEDYRLYSFVSKGPKGDLLKLVKLSPFKHLPDSFNLALGTIRNNTVNYDETTNNHDRDKILATIMFIALEFSKAYPNQKIFIRGRNAATTRLYRGAINHSYKEILRDFIIYGVTHDKNRDEYIFEQFAQDKPYDGFLFRRS